MEYKTFKFENFLVRFTFHSVLVKKFKSLKILRKEKSRHCSQKHTLFELKKVLFLDCCTVSDNAMNFHFTN